MNDMSEWSTLFAATAGAAATLTGLIFVGVSISLNKILSIAQLADRALISLVLLLTILIVSIKMLVPDMSLTFSGLTLLLTGIIAWSVVTYLQVRIYRTMDKTYRVQYIFTMLLDQIAVIPYVICAILLLTGHAAYYGIVFAMLMSFVKAVVDAWVLLIEINR